MAPETRAILVGGSSHLGKSTLAAALAGRLGWRARSTDRLARHPGRPWAPKPHVPPPHVQAHFGGLGADELMASMLAHYRSVWPAAAALVRQHLDDSGPGLVLEGSALLPECAVVLDAPAVSAIWLIAAPGLIEQRIRAGSGYDEADQEARRLIDKFIARSRRFDGWLAEEVRRRRLPSLTIGADASVDEVTTAALAAMRPLARR